MAWHSTTEPQPQPLVVGNKVSLGNSVQSLHHPATSLQSAGVTVLRAILKDSLKGSLKGSMDSSRGRQDLYSSQRSQKPMENNHGDKQPALRNCQVLYSSNRFFFFFNCYLKPQLPAATFVCSGSGIIFLRVDGFLFRKTLNKLPWHKE